MEKLSLGEKCALDLSRRLKPLKSAARQWFCHAGMKFLQSNELTDDEELFLERVTDFFLDNLEELDKDVKFYQRAELGPIRLPDKKKPKVVKI